MYKFFLILFLSVSLQLSSQINPQLLSNSSWTLVKSGMLDGSRDLFRHPSKFLVWKINGNNLCEYVDPWFLERKNCVSFKFERNSIKISDTSTYEIEKLTQDSLIVVEKVNGVTSPDKIRKMSFEKTSVLVKNFTDKAKGDSIVITSRNIMPSLKRDITSEILSTYLDKKYHIGFDVDGEIRIFPKTQKVEVTTENQKENQKRNKNNQAGIDFFRTTVEKEYKAWDLTGFENFEKIIIPYHFMAKTEDSSYGNMSFFARVSYDNGNRVDVNIKDKQTSAENFKKGVEATNKQKYDSAIYFFNKAHEDDNTNTESLYNVVSISLALNNTNVACTALKRLKDLEQTEGTKLYKEKCTGQ